MSVYAAPIDTAPTLEDDRAERLGAKAFSAIMSGSWPEAFEAAGECVALADPVGQPHVLARGQAAAGIVAAVRGDSHMARAILDRSERTAARLGLTDLVDVVDLGRGIEALSAGRYDEAWARLRQLVDNDAEPSRWVGLVALGFLAEAGLHGGSEQSVGAVRARVARLAGSEPAPALRGATAYARAVVEQEVPVDARFDRALAECPADRAFDRARINLARGMCLRREHRVSESRLPLHEALVTFERLGATTWAEQARGELRATGSRRLRRERGAVEALTAQELQIVRLAAAGLTNREIGQRLFLSHRTIGSHLYRVFPKLGVAARSQLRDVLAELPDLDATRGRVAH